jgi:hypothetical protein
VSLAKVAEGIMICECIAGGEGVGLFSCTFFSGVAATLFSTIFNGRLG